MMALSNSGESTLQQEPSQSDIPPGEDQLFDILLAGFDSVNGVSARESALCTLEHVRKRGRHRWEALCRTKKFLVNDTKEMSGAIPWSWSNGLSMPQLIAMNLTAFMRNDYVDAAVV